jgi:hypothetical protein
MNGKTMDGTEKIRGMGRTDAGIEFSAGFDIARGTRDR